jgi:hypothetical protein
MRAAGAVARLDGMRISIRLAETLGPRFATAFDDFDVRTETVLTAELTDDAALHGVLARLRDLDLSVLDLHVDGRRH